MVSVGGVGVLVVVVSVVSAPQFTTGQLFTPIQQQPPGFDISWCGGAKSLAGCQVRLALCSPITKAISGPTGPVTSVLACLALNPSPSPPPQDFYMSIGTSFLEGNPETLVEKAGPITTHTTLRKCVLNATGLVNPDLTLNTTEVTRRLKADFISPGLAKAVVAALPSCPGPVEYSLAPLTACLRKACMTYLDPPPSPPPPPMVPRLDYLGAP